MLSYRADVSNEPFLRRHLPDVRYRRHQLHGQRPRGQGRSHDPHLPQDDQVHLLQVRRLRGDRASRRHLHFAVERGQREDLHLPVVLVDNPGLPVDRDAHISHDHHTIAAHACLSPALPVQADTQGRSRPDSEEGQDGRLVFVLHARGERGLYNISRCDTRAGHEAAHAAFGVLAGVPRGPPRTLSAFVSMCSLFITMCSEPLVIFALLYSFKTLLLQ